MSTLMTTLATVPAVVWHIVVLVGVLLAMRSFWTAWRAHEVPEGPSQEFGRLIWLGRGLRLLLSGLALVGLGFGVMYEVRWLVLASIAFGLEELYEVSMALGVVRYAEEQWRDEDIDADALEPTYGICVRPDRASEGRTPSAS